MNSPAPGVAQLGAALAAFDGGPVGTPSLCADWAVREVVGHLIPSLRLEVIRARGTLAMVRGFHKRGHDK